MEQPHLLRIGGPAFWGSVLALLLLLPRLLDLGTVLTVDEPLWRARAHTFMEGLVSFDPAKTFSSGQPGVTTMWLVGLALPWKSLAASQAAVAVGVTITTLLSLGLLARLTNPEVAIAGGIFMALDPFFIAHSRVVHTDALLGSLMLLTLLLLSLAWRTGSARYYDYSGVATALAILTKLHGLFLLVPAALIALVSPFRLDEDNGHHPRGTGFRARTGRVAWFALPLLCSLVILWPALVFSPAVPLSRISERATLHARSAPVGSGGGDPWYYPRELVRRLSPVVTVLLPLAAAGLALGSGRRLPAFPARGPLIFLLGMSALYVLLLSIAQQKSDRYILIAHLTLDIAAGASLLWLGDILTRRWPRWRVRVAAALVGMASVFLLRDVFRLHPHYLAHWNQLVPVPADAKIGWGEGLELAAQYLKEQEPDTKNLVVASYYPGVLTHFLDARIERLHTYANNPDIQYVVLYRSMFGRDPGSYEADAVNAFLGSTPSEGTTVQIEGNSFRLKKIIPLNTIPYAWIFRRVSCPLEC